MTLVVYDGGMFGQHKKIPLHIVRNFFLLTGFGILVFAGGYETASVRQGRSSNAIIQKFVGNPASGIPQGADFSKFWEVWNRLESNYVDPSALDYTKMTYGAIKGLAQSLGDPYTQYLPPDQNKQATEDLNGSFFGVGIELGYKDQTLAVVAPLPGSPAEKAGVKSGDLILHIKDEKSKLDVDTQGMTLPTAVTDIRGEKGTPVILTLYRAGTTKTFDVTITRDEIIVPTVELKFITKNGKKIADLELHKFGGRTDTEWSAKVADIVAAKPAGVVLDLRDNPGGYLDGAVFVSGEFLPSGVIVKQVGRTDTQTFSVDRKGSLTTVPLVVLVNKGSASASEITAGALQDNKRAQVVGEQSFGKGTVQEVEDLSDGSSLHVTIAKWVLPSGRWIGKEGITPDVKVLNDDSKPDTDAQLDAAVGLLLK